MKEVKEKWKEGSEGRMDGWMDGWKEVKEESEGRK